MLTIHLPGSISVPESVKNNPGEARFALRRDYFMSDSTAGYNGIHQKGKVRRYGSNTFFPNF